jgi:FOG: GGDEF domain
MTEDLKYAVAEAKKNPKKLVELPFENEAGQIWVVKVSVTGNAAPIWILQKGDGPGASVMWKRDSIEVLMIQNKIRTETQQSGGGSAGRSGRHSPIVAADLEEAAKEIAEEAAAGAAWVPPSAPSGTPIILGTGRPPSADVGTASSDAPIITPVYKPVSNWEKTTSQQQALSGQQQALQSQSGRQAALPSQATSGAQPVLQSPAFLVPPSTQEWMSTPLPFPTLDAPSSAPPVVSPAVSASAPPAVAASAPPAVAASSPPPPVAEAPPAPQQEPSAATHLSRVRKKTKAPVVFDGEDLTATRELPPYESPRRTQETAKPAAPKMALPPPIEFDKNLVNQVHANLADASTGLMTFPALLFFLFREFARFQKAQSPLSIVSFEIALRLENSILPFPQEAIALVAQRLRPVCDPVDITSHVMGGEFATLLCSADGAAALRFAESLHTALTEEPLSPAFSNAQVLLAIGVASIPETCSHPGVLVAAARQAKEMAKGGGKPYMLFG